jgi:hypothetical protein
MEHRENEKNARATPQGDAARKPYAPPRLHVYGDVATLTRAIGFMSAKSDGGSGKVSKTA